MDYKDINRQAASLYDEEYIEEDDKNSEAVFEEGMPSNRRLPVIFGRKGILVIIGVLLIITIMVIVGRTFFIDDYETPIKKQIELFNEHCTDTMSYVKYATTADIYEKEMKAHNNGSFYLYAPESDDSFEMAFGHIEDTFGDDYSFVYNIIEANPLDEEYIELVQQEFDTGFEDADEIYEEEVEPLKLSKAYEVKLSIAVVGSKKEDAYIVNTAVLKVNGQWIVSGQFMYDIIYECPYQFYD